MKRFLQIILAATLSFSACKYEAQNNVDRNISGATSTGEAVMVMDTAMVSSKLVTITSDGTLVFNNLAPEDRPLKGDIICSAPSLNAPQGFLYRVKEVRTKGGETTIVTEFASIEEAVENADVDEIFEMPIEEIEEEEGVEIEELEDDDNLQLRRSSINKGIRFKVDKYVNENLNVKGFIELKTTVRCELNIGSYETNYFLLTAQPQFRAQLEAKVEVDLDREITFTIANITCARIVFWAGVVPVVFTPKISIIGVLNSKGEVKLQATLIDWDYSYLFGVRYQNGKLEAISQNTSKPAEYLKDVQFILDNEMKLQPKLTFRFHLYNSGTYAGVHGDFYAKLKVNDNGNSDKNLSLFCGLAFGADAQLRILGYNLGSINTTFLSLEWLIWERKWGDIGEIRSYILDNGYAYTGWHGRPENTVPFWMGNKFIVEDSGELTSINIWSAGWNQGGYDYVTVEIFDSYGEFLGSSSQFMLPDQAWRTVALNNIPFSGTFFVMVRWPAYSHTNFVGIDLNGPNANKRLAYRYSENSGWMVLEDGEEYGSERWQNSRGVFLIRANATVYGKSLIYGDDDNLPKGNPENLFNQSDKPFIGIEYAPALR